MTMTEYKLIFNFRRFEQVLKSEGYTVSAIETGFYIHNSKGTIVADCHTVDGLRGFLQGIEWAKESK